MSNKSRVSLDTDLESINRRLDEIEGPIKETLDRVRQALVGTEDGTQQGLLARVLIAESSLEATQQAVKEIQDQLKTGDVRMDKLELEQATTGQDVTSLKETRTDAKKSRKHWRWLIIGALLTGAIGLGWAWIEKIWIGK